MKITAIEAMAIRIPMVEPFKIAVGSLTHSNHVLVKMETDAGLTGWGESTTFPEVYGYDQAGLVHILRDQLIPAVIGLDPRNIIALHQRMNLMLPHNTMAKTALDLAAHDIAAQAAAMPLYLYLGGSRVEAVPVIGAVSIVPPEKAAADSAKLVSQGYTTIKVKIGLSAAEDVARLKAVREAVGPEIPLRVDGNCGYDRDTALRTFRQMEPLGLEWIEQPLPAWDLEGHAALARALDTPIALDESIRGPHEAYQAITLGAADVINIKIQKAGGLYPALSIAALARAAGVPCFLGGCIETSPGMAAGAHFYAAAEGVVSGTEILGPPHYTDDLVKNPLKVAGGFIQLPTSPGLGVEIDLDKVEKYRAEV